MPTNNINVTLDTSTGTNRLSVTDNGGQNQVSQNPNPTTINWHLTGSLTTANFLPMDQYPPGFEWVNPTSADVFGPPGIQGNGNIMSITDNHSSSSTNGQWIYMLRVNYNGSVITTTASVGIGGTVNNPIIVNH